MALRVDDVDVDRDRTLVERFQAGDESAFEELYARYFDRLQRFCMRRLRDPDAAEEIAQEAFVRALASLTSLDGPRHFYPWMTVIARRLCVDRVREQARVAPDPAPDPGHRSVAVGDLSDGVAIRADFEALDRALERVRGRHREVLHLRDWEGLSYRTIAHRMDVPVTTVEALLHRARRAVRREFLAVNGGRGPQGLAAIVGLRHLVLRLRVLTDRLALGPNWGGLAGPVATAVAAGVVLLSPAALDSTGPGAPSADRPVAAVEPAPSAEPSPSGTAEAGLATPHPAPGPDRHDSDPTPPPPAVSAGPVDAFTGPDGSGRAADEADGMPVGGRLGPAFLGLDPPAVVTSVSGGLAR